MRRSVIQAFYDIWMPGGIASERDTLLRQALAAAFDKQVEIEQEVYRQMLNMPLMTREDLGI